MDKGCEEWVLQHLPNYYDMFRDNSFKTLGALAIIIGDDLKEMGITSVGERKEILSKTLMLKKTGGPDRSEKKSMSTKLLQSSKYKL